MFRLRLRSRSFCWFVGIAVVVVAILVPDIWRRVDVARKIRSAKALMNMGSISQAGEARRQIEKAQGDQPFDNPELIYLLARACRRTGDVGKSLEYLQIAEAAGWDPLLVRQQQQLAYFQRGHIDDSATLDRMLRQNASDELAYEVYEALAKGYLFTYRFNDAIHCLNFWSEWCTDAIDPRIWRARIWEQIEDWEKATNEYRHVLRLDPKHTEARLALARILLQELNQPETAYAELKTSLSHAPGDINSQVGMAACERLLGQPETAEKRLRDLLTRQPTPQQLANIRMELGQILLDRSAVPEAIEAMESVVASDPLNSAARYTLGTAYAANGDQSKAQECFERSRVLGEQFARLSTITAELVNHPENANLRWEAGRILMDQGMHTEGAAWMATALIYEPDHKATHESLAHYYETIKPDERLARHHREKFSAAK